MPQEPGKDGAITDDKKDEVVKNNDNLAEDQKPFVPADTVDSRGTVWPTVGENIRKGVNGELADVYGRMPDLDAVAEFWSKMTGKKCSAVLSTVSIEQGKIIQATNLSFVPEGNIYVRNNSTVFYTISKTAKINSSTIRSDGSQSFIHFDLSTGQSSTFEVLFVYSN